MTAPKKPQTPSASRLGREAFGVWRLIRLGGRRRSGGIDGSAEQIPEQARSLAAGRLFDVRGQRRVDDRNLAIHAGSALDGRTGGVRQVACHQPLLGFQNSRGVVRGRSGRRAAGGRRVAGQCSDRRLGRAARPPKSLAEPLR